MQLKQNLSIYIHWPFCEKICPYCDFNRTLITPSLDVSQWQNAYANLLDFLCTKLLNDALPSVHSIYFGGGTPSLMPHKLIDFLINLVRTRFSLTPNCEITLEANPNNVSLTKLQDLRALGVNRLSLGVQSLSPSYLELLGRNHSTQDSLKALEYALTTFPKLNVDLIYALPKQTLTQVQDELQFLLQFPINHLSLYQLTIKPNTPFFVRNYKENLQSPQMFQLVHDTLATHDFTRYEISSHSRHNQQSIHNLCYWQSGDYLALGPGAQGRITTHDKQRIAFANIYSSKRWLQTLSLPHNHQIDPLSSQQILSPQQQLMEFVMMGLRLKQGLHSQQLYHSCGVSLAQLLPVHKLQQLQHSQYINELQPNPQSISLSPKGVLLHDSITSFILDNDTYNLST